MNSASANPAPRPTCDSPHEHNRLNPSLFDALATNPTVDIDPFVQSVLTDDNRSWTRFYLFPILRLVTRVMMMFVLIVKRILPVDLASERLLGKLTTWFVRHLVSPQASCIVLRHFSVETALLNFIARNSGDESKIRRYDLKTTRIAQLDTWKGQNTIIAHDANLFNLFLDLGHARDANVKRPKRAIDLDFTDLAIATPEVDLNARRWYHLDLYSTLYLTALFIALFVDRRTTERAINSFQLDEGIMKILAALTGDVSFRFLVSRPFPMWLGMPTSDPARDLHWHILAHEHAHHKLSLKAQNHPRVVHARRDCDVQVAAG